jgi:hypothetical protein
MNLWQSVRLRWYDFKCRKILKNMGKNNDMLTQLISDCDIDVIGNPLGIAFQGALLGAVLEHIPPEEFSRIMDDAFRAWLCECKNKKNGELCEMCTLRAKKKTARQCSEQRQGS